MIRGYAFPCCPVSEWRVDCSRMRATTDGAADAVPTPEVKRTLHRAIPIRWLACALLTLTGCAGSDTPFDGLRHNKVGFRQLQLLDAKRDRPLNVNLWYPADAGATEAAAPYRFFVAGRVADGAPFPVGSKRYPLILVSHGDKGNNYNQAWIAEVLAANGYIVAAVDHWLNTSQSNEPEQTMRMWQRPEDMSFVLDRLLADPDWRAHIDPARVGALGHSAGGYTALALAGAIYHPTLMDSYCAGPQRGPDCDIVAGIDRSKIDWSDADKSYKDSRFSAFVAMAPAIGPGIDGESLQGIALPVAIISARDDEVLPVDTHAEYYARHIASAELTLLPAGGHFVFLPRCTVFTHVIDYFTEFDICGRNIPANRLEVQQIIAAKTLDFFARKLTPPAEA